LDGQVVLDGGKVGGELNAEGHGPGGALGGIDHLGALLTRVPVAVAAVVDGHFLPAATLGTPEVLADLGLLAHQPLDRVDPGLGPGVLGDGAADHLSGLEAVDHGWKSLKGPKVLEAEGRESNPRCFLHY